MTDCSMEGTIDSARRSWVDTANDGMSDFPIQNLPWGVFRGSDGVGRIGVAIGDRVLDVRAAVEAQVLDVPPETACSLCAGTLNAFMGQGQASWRAARAAVAMLLDGESPVRPELLHDMSDIEMLLLQPSVTTPIFMRLGVMPQMLVGCSGPMVTRSCPIICICLWGTTVA